MGEAGEDKKVGEAGEIQAIVAMNIMATLLTVKAVACDETVTHAVVFGHARTVEKQYIVPYKMTMDYVKQRTTVNRGPKMKPSDFFNSVKYYLDNIEHLLIHSAIKL